MLAFLCIFIKICLSGKILKRCKGRITERNYEKTELWSYRKIELWKDVITENGIKKRQKYRIKE